MNTLDNIRDLANRIVDRMVDDKVVEDYRVDTEYATEVDVGNIIFGEILRERALELYSKDKFNQDDHNIINEAIETGCLETDDILDSFVGYVENSNLDWDIDFTEHYQNGLTHKQNFEVYEEWLQTDEEHLSSTMYGVDNNQ